MKNGWVIVEQARTWIGTKYHHQGRLKKTARDAGGVDCIGLILGVMAEFELKSRLRDAAGRRIPFTAFDRKGYSQQPQGQLLKILMDKYLVPIAVDAVAEGDMLLFRIVNNPQHVGFVSSYPSGGLGLIHCYAAVGRVVEHRLDDKWRNRVVGAYRFNDDCFG